MYIGLTRGVVRFSGMQWICCKMVRNGSMQKYSWTPRIR